jgi:hypothetical protein
VTGAKGRAPTKYFKGSLTYMGGMMVSGALVICGRDARRKALAVADGIIQKTRNIFNEMGIDDYTSLNIEVFSFFFFFFLALRNFVNLLIFRLLDQSILMVSIRKLRMHVKYFCESLRRIKTSARW